MKCLLIFAVVNVHPATVAIATGFSEFGDCAVFTDDNRNTCDVVTSATNPLDFVLRMNLWQSQNAFTVNVTLRDGDCGDNSQVTHPSFTTQYCVDHPNVFFFFLNTLYIDVGDKHTIRSKTRMMRSFAMLIFRMRDMKYYSRTTKKSTSHGYEVLSKYPLRLIQRPCNQRNGPKKNQTSHQAQ